MSTLLIVGATLIVVGILAYHRAPLWGWSVVVLTALGAVVAENAAHPLALSIWAVAGVGVAILNVGALRRRLLSAPLWRMMRQQMPAISQTEREALEAGTVGWDAELFAGNPNWQKLLSEPQPQLSAVERAFLDGPVEELCQLINDWEITEVDHDLPPEVWQFIKDKGFFGMIIPREYGGLGFSALAHSSVVMKIATRSITAAVTVMVPNSLGPAELLLHYGTKEQRDHYLPRLARGDEVPCFALTAPEAGSDAAAMQDSGVVCYGEFEGKKKVLGIRLNWRKRYITLGPVATVLGLAFKLYDPDQLLGGKKDYGITCALIPTGTKGVEIGRRHAPLNQSFMNGPNEGHEVFIPIDWIIGGAEYAGKGWYMLMESLAVGRSISLPALSTGGGKLVSLSVGAYARVRTQFNQAIGNFEGIEEVLARIGGHTYLMEAARKLTCGYVDQGEKPSVISAMMKYHLTERMRVVVNDGMDILGGRGISLGPNNFLGRIYQAIPVSITVEGANILTRNMIIFGQGALRCHPYLFDELNTFALKEAQGVKAFDALLGKHTQHILANTARTLFMGLTGGWFTATPGGGPLHHDYQRLTRMSSAFALLADATLLLLGGNLKRRENLSARLGDILSQLYLSSAVLKQYEDNGQLSEELPLAKWALEDSQFAMQKSFHQMLRNLPSRPLAWLLRLIIFPLGRRWASPHDALNHQVATLLLAPSALRDRLTEGVFIPKEAAEPIAILEEALRRTISAEPLERELRHAIKAGRIVASGEEGQLEEAIERNVLSEHEVAQLRQARQLRMTAIGVDDFPHEYWREEVCHGTNTAA